jgi:hypothetical protein
MTSAALGALVAHAGHLRELGGGTALPVPLLAALAVVVGALAFRGRDGVTTGVVLCAAGAGTIHAAVTPQHFRESAVFGWFFLAVTVWQMAVVVGTLHRPSPGLWVSTAVGTGLLLAIWGLSRTAGLPAGPEPWTTEPAGLLDIACAAYEVGMIAGCLRLAYHPAGRVVGRIPPGTLSPVRLPSRMPG